MAAKTNNNNMDALGSFTYLIDNVANWTESIKDLAIYAEQKHQDFIAEYSRLVLNAHPRRQKSPSLASIHTIDDNDPHTETEVAMVIIQAEPETETERAPPHPDPVEINPLEAGNRYLYAQAQKKRKPDSLQRSGASGPQKFRSKNQVVIYYDSRIQEELDKMFKAIVIARNNLRKGKNALSLSRGFQLPNVRQRFDPTSHPRASTYGPKETAGAPSHFSAFAGFKLKIPEINQLVMNDHEIAITQTDKNLESIQTLCETAAHQFLRDGDCQTELRGVVGRFEAVLAQAKITAESLQKEKEQAEAEAARETMDCDASMETNEHSSATASETTLLTDPSLGHHFTNSKGLQPPKSFNSKPYVIPGGKQLYPPGIASNNIEIDDASDQSSLEIDIGSYRNMTARRLRA